MYFGEMKNNMPKNHFLKIFSLPKMLLGKGKVQEKIDKLMYNKRVGNGEGAEKID